MSGFLSYILNTCICVLGICMIFALVRVIKGPRLADRIMGVNMVGTMTDVIIIMLSIVLDEGWLLDVAILYTLISFLSVVVLTKVYMGVYKERAVEDAETIESEEKEESK
ncbi:MAG: sodium:proton antiporter [Lachnospiraceae bacterium]|nr:sodium:proton antiporter [Lachnospiraceae bacterium]